MSQISIFVASKMEADPVARLLGVSRWNSPSHTGPITAGPNQVEFFITGLGPKRAKKSATEIMLHDQEPQPAGHPQRPKPEGAIAIGLCGSLTDSLPETAIAVYSNCLSAMNGGSSCPSSPELSARITALLNTQEVPCSSAVGITSPRIVITKDDKLGLARAGAQVVDMESDAILSAARQAGVPATVGVHVTAGPARAAPPSARRTLGCRLIGSNVSTRFGTGARLVGKSPDN